MIVSMKTKAKLKQVNGIWLPEHDTHFSEMITRNPIVAEKGTYQFNKVSRALDLMTISDMREGTAIDVGAHVGLWSRILEIYFKAVYAFEPEPVAYDCLTRNTSKTSCHLNAIADKVRPLRLKVVKDNSGNSRIADDGEIEVMALTLDHFNRSNVKFIKIDVEGFEWFVLQGAVRTINENKPLIVVEQKKGNAEHYNLQTTQACAFLENLGMKLKWRISGDYCYGW